MIKVERSQPAPESLAVEAQKKNGQYNRPDVTGRLKHDFHDKCYICGLHGLQDPVVEHRLPHKNGLYPDRKFDWNNLFWSCGHCNGVKNKEKYDSGIIDCCTKDPEELLSFDWNGKNISVSAVNIDDPEAQRTADLVYEVFNVNNTGTRVITSKVRFNALLEQMNIIIKVLDRYKKHPECRYSQRMLRVHLARESAFAEFKRAYVRKRLDEFPELEEYLM